MACAVSIPEDSSTLVHTKSATQSTTTAMFAAQHVRVTQQVSISAIPGTAVSMTRAGDLQS